MSAAQESKREARAAAAAEREAEREFELAMQKQILDWIAVTSVQPGDVLTITVPADKFCYPGTNPEDMTDEQKMWMEDCHRVLLSLLTDLGKMGKPVLGAIIGEGMTLEDLPPPASSLAEREPTSKIVKPGQRIFLPHGAKI